MFLTKGMGDCLTRRSTLLGDGVFGSGSAPLEHGNHRAVILREPGDTGTQVLLLACRRPIEQVAARARREHVFVFRQPSGKCGNKVGKHGSE